MWAAFHNARDLLGASYNPGVADFVFIHLSDLKAILSRSRIGIPEAKWTSVCTFRSLLEKDKMVGNGHAVLVFVSGTPEINPKDMAFVRERLSSHDGKQLCFFPKIPHGLDAASIERFFETLVKESAGEHKGLDDRLTELSAVREAETLCFALRMLWDVYVLSLKGSPDVPDRLKKAQEMVRSCKFTRDYWSPILKDGRLDQRLAHSTNKHLIEIVKILSNQEHWENLKVSEEIVQQYKKGWFGQMGMALSGLAPDRKT
jgi:hypothetical protein